MYTVLMIEDEEIEQKAFRKFMEQYFPEVMLLKGALDGTEGILSVEGEKPDIVILDVRMSDMDGLTLLEKIRGKGYQGKIIIQTAYDFFDYVQKALHLGADAYILKPASHENMRKVIQKCLDDTERKYKEEQRQERDRRQLQDMREYITIDIINKMLTSNAKRNISMKQLQKMGIDNIAGFFLAVEILGADPELGNMQEYSFDFLNSGDNPSLLIQKSGKYRATIFVSDDVAESMVWYHYTAGRLMKEIAEGMMVHYGVHVRIGAGKPYRKTEDMYASYQQSCHALMEGTEENPFIFYTGKYRVIRYHEFWESFSLTKLNPRTKELREAVKEIVGDFLEFVRPFGMNDCRYQVMEFWQSFQENLIKNVSRQDEVQSDPVRDMEELYRLEDHGQLQQWLENKMQGLLEGLLRSESFSYNILLSNAMEFIRNHYMEDLSLQRIADEVGISSYYLSHLFKEQLGCSMSSYLVNIRMQQMTRMLHEHDYTVRELAFKLGYRDEAYFSQVVKKNTGKTIGEIKRAIRKQKNSDKDF